MKKIILLLIFLPLWSMGQLGLGLGLTKGGISGSPYCEQANTYFTAQTVPFSSEQKTIINTFIKKIVDDGVFAKLKGLWLASCAEDSTQYKINVITPGTYNLTHGGTGGSVTFNRGIGFKSSGTNYLKTGIVPSAIGGILQLNSMSIGAYLYDNVGGSSNVPMGSRNATLTAAFVFYPRYTGDKCYIGINNHPLSPDNYVTNTVTSGTWICTRTASNVLIGYKNGVELYNKNSASNTLANTEIYVSCSNSAGTAASFWAGYIGMAFIGGGLTPTDAVNLNTAYASLVASIELQKMNKIRVLIPTADNLYVRSYYSASSDIVLYYKKTTSGSNIFQPYAHYYITKATLDNATDYAGVGNVSVWSNSDEFAPSIPLNLRYSYGGNHHLGIVKVTKVGHGKVWANDRGSLYKDAAGAVDYWYLSGINGNDLYFVKKAVGDGSSWTMYPSNAGQMYTTLNYVSGGFTPNTGNIVPTTIVDTDASFLGSNITIGQTLSYLVNGTTPYTSGVIWCDSLAVLQSFGVSEPRSLRYVTSNRYYDADAWWNETYNHRFYPLGTTSVETRKVMTAGTVTDIEGNSLIKSMNIDFVVDGNATIMATCLSPLKPTGSICTGYFPGTKVQGAYTAKSVIGQTNASPINLTITAHGLITNDTIEVLGYTGNWSALDTTFWTVTKVDNDNILLSTNYSAGGTSNSTTWGAATGTPVVKKAIDFSKKVRYKLPDAYLLATPYMDTTNHRLPDRFVYYASATGTPTTYFLGHANGIFTGSGMGTHNSRFDNIYVTKSLGLMGSAGKFRMNILNKGGVLTSFNYPTYFYYSYFNPQSFPNAQYCYWYKIGSYWYIYIGYLTNVTDDLINLPDYFDGKSISVQETKNCTVTESTVPSAGVHITNSVAGEGWIILKLQ